MRNRNFKGSIVSVTVQNCIDSEAETVYAPSKTNIYHSEIYGNKERKLLTAGQRKHLAASAIVVE